MAKEPRPAARPASDEPGPSPLDQHLCSVGFCPVAMLLTATQQVRPDVVEHLLSAGRELLLAAEAVVDARAEGFRRTATIEHIEIG